MTETPEVTLATIDYVIMALYMSARCQVGVAAVAILLALSAGILFVVTYRRFMAHVEAGGSE